MAIRTISNTGGSWSSTGTWIEGAVPTAADEVVATATSGNLFLSSSAVCRSFNLTGYVGTFSPSGYYLSIGDNVAPTNMLAIRLEGTLNLDNNNTTFRFISTAPGIHLIDYNNFTVRGSTLIFGSSTYQFVADFTSYTLDFISGGLDFNNKNVTFIGTGVFQSVGSTARVLSLTNSIVTCSGGSGYSIGGSNLTMNSNTAKFIVTIAGITFFNYDNFNYNGTSFIIQGGTGAVNFSNTVTIKDLIINPSSGAAKSITAIGKSLTITGKLYCAPSNGTVSFTVSQLIKTSGIVNLYGISGISGNFIGGAIYKLRNACDTPGSTYLTKIQSYVCLDLVNGNDANMGYGWYKVAYTGATGNCPQVDDILTGATSLNTATVSYLSEYEWDYFGAGTIYISVKSGEFQAEIVNCSTGGSFNIASNFINGALRTINTGVTVNRVGIGDIVKISKTPNPINIGNGTWTNCKNLGNFSTAISITSSTNTAPIEITKASHGFITGDVIQVIGHTSNASANGAWVITKVDDNKFTLNGSTGIGVGGANGTLQQINSKAVVLETAGQINIDRSHVVWTGANDGTTSLNTSDSKEGGTSVKITMDASTQPNLLQAFKSIETLDLSNYQKISFWFKNSITIPNDTTWSIHLCSDTAGVTIVDSFIIPTIIANANWLPLTLTKVGGGNLGSSIQSIAIYSGSTAPANSSVINIGNIIACTTNGLNLQSLLSKNGLSQGGLEGFYGIQSINRNVVLLDTIPSSTQSNSGRGYSTVGPSPETVPTYIRETHKTDMPVNYATGANTPVKSGTPTNYIKWEGGYDIESDTQIGETFFDGLTNWAYGFYNTKSYQSMSRLNFCRYYGGILFNSVNGGIIHNCLSLNNNQTGLSFSGVLDGVINTITSACNGNAGVYLSNCSGTTLVTKIIAANNNNDVGITFYAVSYLTVDEIGEALNNGTTGVYTTLSHTGIINLIRNTINNASCGVRINDTSTFIINEIQNTKFNNLNGIQILSGINIIIYKAGIIQSHTYALAMLSVGGFIAQANTSQNQYTFYVGMNNEGLFRNCTFGDTNLVYAYTSTARFQIWSLKEDGIDGNNIGYNSSGTSYWQSIIKHGAELGAYKVTSSGTLSKMSMPYKLKLAEVACSANKLVTVTVWVKKETSPSVDCKLKVYADTATGIPTNIECIKTDDTNWELLTLNFTPTFESIVDLFFEYWYSNTSPTNIYIGTINVSQAV